MQRVQEVARKLNIYLVNSLNPFRLEGQKTIMYRVLEAACGCGGRPIGSSYRAETWATSAPSAKPDGEVLDPGLAASKA